MSSEPIGEPSQAPGDKSRPPATDSQADMSTSASPTDTRHPLSRFESIVPEPADDVSTSFQSTDTVRRRPEGGLSGYGKFFLKPPTP